MKKTNTFIVDSYSKNKKFTRKCFDFLKKIFDQELIIIPEFVIENDFFEIELTPGV